MTLDGREMAREWDAIARRNPYYGVVSWPDFQDPTCIDEARFDESGRIQAVTFLRRLGLRDTASLEMVEIGCGLGRMTHEFARRFRLVYALDVSAEMIGRARARWGGLANVRFLVGSGQGLEGIADASVDFAFSFLVLQHVPDPAVVLRYVRETGRVLRPGGVAFLQLGTEGAPRRRDGRLAALGRRLTGALGGRREWWNRGLRESRVPARPALTVEITSRPVWRGCRVAAADVEGAVAGAGLRLRALEGVGSQYTFVTAAKR